MQLPPLIAVQVNYSLHNQTDQRRVHALLYSWPTKQLTRLAHRYTAAHRRKCGWIRTNPQLTVLIVNPDNPYHWVQIKCTVQREELEDGPNGTRVTQQLDNIWQKYTGDEPPYGLRDPSIDEKRVLFVCQVDRIATFGKP